MDALWDRVMKMMSDRGHHYVGETTPFARRFEPNHYAVLAPALLDVDLSSRSLSVGKIQTTLKASLPPAKVEPGARIIVFCDKPPVKYVTQELDLSGVYRRDGVAMEVLPASLVTLDIINHALQPKFERCEDPQAVLDFFGSRIPMMSVSDPVSLYYRYRPGDIVKISRKAYSAPLEIVYRRVR